MGVERYCTEMARSVYDRDRTVIRILLRWLLEKVFEEIFEKGRDIESLM